MATQAYKLVKQVYKNEVFEYYVFDDAKQSDNEEGITVVLDIDDFTVRDAAWMLQNMLNGHRFKNGVIFETKVLDMFEQLCRNCLHYAEEVEKECDLAKKERREPDLSRFSIFRNYKAGMFKKYSEPVEIVRNIYKAAKFLKEYYCEERDTCLEIDTHPKGERVQFDMAEEEKTINHCRDLIGCSKDVFHEINEFCLGEVIRLSEEAKKQNVEGQPLVRPEYGELVNIETNDINKRNKANQKHFEELSSEEQKREAIEHQKYVLYEKAVEDVKNCFELENRIQDVITNGKVFTMESERVIDYDKIYCEENLDPDTCELIDVLLEDPNVKEILFGSHYNGEAEGIPKVRLMGSGRFKGVKGIVLIRFHDKKHNGKRRGRSCKMLYILGITGRPSKKHLLGDDSVINCLEALKLDCAAVLYKPLTDAEIIKGRHSCFGCPRMLKHDSNRFTMFIRTLVEANRNSKSYRKTL